MGGCVRPPMTLHRGFRMRGNRASVAGGPASEGRGKRGGARVIYIDILTKERLYLLFAYPKNVQEDLTSEQKKQLQMLIDAIKEE